MWYGIGNHVDVQPVRMKVGLSPAGTLDALQRRGRYRAGFHTIMTHDRGRCRGPACRAVCAVSGRHLGLTADASRPRRRADFVSGMRPNAPAATSPADPAPGECRPGCRLSLDGARLTVRERGDEVRAIDSGERRRADGRGHIRPPTTRSMRRPGVPYATYAFAAQMATVEVDIELAP